MFRLALRQLSGAPNGDSCPTPFKGYIGRRVKNFKKIELLYIAVV
ncbi:MAG: hypothetical protein [Olavius algarvensis Delta 4 endosymbiont]|nr:MAG: hypothetical protein [Olavius algarvensis Delta 4 endosymbiont]